MLCDVFGQRYLRLFQLATNAKKAGNRILEAIGVSQEDIISSVRVSFNAYQTDEEIVEAAKIVAEVYKDIKERVS